MRTTIYKYTLDYLATPAVSIDMPEGAEILSVQLQRGELQLWALVEDGPGVEHVPRTVAICTTGNDCCMAEGLNFIGTVQLYGGEIVVHVFAD